jgi:hypothetical protein
MLAGMYRVALLALLIGCESGPKNDQKSAGKEAPQEVINVPKGSGSPEGNAPSVGAPAEDPSKPSQGTKDRAKDPKFNLQPSEGTLTIGKLEGAAGATGSAEIKLAPGKGYHVATDYPIKIWLEAPDGVKLEKTYLTAGGRNKVQGDAATLTEQALAFAVKATPDKAGTFEIQGWFNFGICEQDSCHPRTQPIKIQVAAK